MAQQTTISVVVQRYPRWLAQFPTVHSLAMADEATVLRAWEGLGYYSRARNLHLSAKQITAFATFPQTLTEWLALPGVGLYTANSILSRAFNQPVLAFDANLKRIFMRLLGTLQLTTLQEKKIEQDLLPWLQQESAGVINQAFMRLGQIYCKKKPLCESCPLQTFCTAHLTDQTAHIPPVKTRTITSLSSFVLVLSYQNRLMLQQRSHGVGRGMFSFPRFSADEWDVFTHQHPNAQFVPLPQVVHIYTRYREALLPHYTHSLGALTLTNTVWHTHEELESLPLLSVYRTIADNAKKLEATLRS